MPCPHQQARRALPACSGRPSWADSASGRPQRVAGLGSPSPSRLPPVRPARYRLPPGQPASRSWSWRAVPVLCGRIRSADVWWGPRARAWGLLRLSPPPVPLAFLSGTCQPPRRRGKVPRPPLSSGRGSVTGCLLPEVGTGLTSECLWIFLCGRVGITSSMSPRTFGSSRFLNPFSAFLTPSVRPSRLSGLTWCKVSYDVRLRFCRASEVSGSLLLSLVVCAPSPVLISHQFR